MTLGSHQRCVGQSQQYLDPCAADPRPWPCADESWSEGGLDRAWRGRVWLNPPFDRREVGEWVRRLAEHGDGVALLHARTETAWFAECWRRADAMLFLARRVKFCRSDGTEQRANSGAPPVLIAFGEDNARCLRECGLRGYFVFGWGESIRSPRFAA